MLCGPGGAGPLFLVSHKKFIFYLQSSTLGGRVRGRVDSLATGTCGRGRECLYYRRAGSVAMYCRQHGYPTAPLISYKIAGIWVLWGFDVPLSELTVLVAQCLDLGHDWHKSNPHRWDPLSPPLPNSLTCPLTNPLSASACQGGMSPASRLRPALLTLIFQSVRALKMNGPGGILGQVMTLPVVR